MALLAIAFVAACATPPSSPPVSASPEASVAPAGGEQAWQSAVVLAPDRAAFARAAASGRPHVGAHTAWVEDELGRWIPAEGVDDANRLGIIEWHDHLISWADGAVIQISDDGQSWSDATTQPDEGNPSALVPVADQLVLLGAGTQRRIGAWRSSDASTWTGIDGSPLGMRAAAVIPGRGVVAVGQTGPEAAAWITSDTLTWTPLPFPRQADAGTSALSGVAASETGVVAIGDVDGVPAVWSSEDLTAWTRSAAFAGNDTFLASVTHRDGLFVIAGRRDNRPALWASADGRVWSPVALPVAAGVTGDASDAMIEDGRVVVFGWTTQDAGNGGSFRTGYLVWVLPRSS